MSAIEALIKQVIIQAPWMDTTPAQVELATLMEYANHRPECCFHVKIVIPGTRPVIQGKCDCGLEQFLEKFRKEE